MKKLGSQAHWRDLVTICEPKNQTAQQKWHKIPVFGANGSFELKHFRGFSLPKHSTRHTATSSDVNIENRDSERHFKLFNLVKGRWRGSPKPPFAWELEALFGIPAKTKLFPWAFGDLWFWPPYPFQRHLKSFLWLDRASSTKKYEKLPVWPPVS